MTATLMPLMITRIMNASGTAPLAGGKVYTYEAGTTTPKTSYTDAAATVANTNPVILDSTGSASIWISGNYKVNVTDSADVQQPNYPVDNVADFHTIDNITATSTTSLSVSIASKIFTTQADKFFTIGLPVFIVANGSITNNMYGQITAYSGTQLTVNVSAIQGSGTFASWTISLSGPPGPTGATGSSGAGSGDMLKADNLSGLASNATSRANLGLGSAATLDAGTSANQLVKLDGSAKLPAVDGSALTGIGSIILLATKTASASASLDFTSNISSSYSRYIVVFENLLTSTTSSINLKISSNNGSSYADLLASYKETLSFTTGNPPTYTATASSPALLTTSLAGSTWNGQAEFVANTAGFIWTSVLSVLGQTAVHRTTVTNSNTITGANAFQLLPSSGTFSSGKAYLYGIKNT